MIGFWKFNMCPNHNATQKLETMDLVDLTLNELKSNKRYFAQTKKQAIILYFL